MSQHDYNIANAPGATVRADVNALAEAIASLNGGASSPSVTFANMFWMDETNDLLKMRNRTNSGWITLASVVGSTFKLALSAINTPASGSWFGTSERFPFIATDGVMEVGASLDFHPDAAGTEDYRARVNRATGTNGILNIVNTGNGGIEITTDTGTFRVNSNVIAPIPIGALMPYGGTTAPTNWLMLYGQNVSRTTYAGLFAIFGTTFGVGNGTTTFTLPDLRGRVIAGKDNMGGVSADRLTTYALDGDVLGAYGGLEYHTLTAAQLASHAHVVDPPNTGTSGVGDHAHAYTFTDPGFAAMGTWPSASSNFVSPTGLATSGAGAHSHAVDIGAFASGSAGSDGAHNNVQPTLVLNYIVYAGA